MNENGHKGGMVVGGVDDAPVRKRRLSRRRLMLLACVAAGAVVIIGAATGYAVYATARSNNISVNADDLPDDYMALSDTQIARKFEAKTGLRITDITDKRISGWRLNSFDKAYQAALALQALSKYDKSEQAFALADKKSDGKASYTFYLQYADVAAVNKDNDRNSELLEKAKSVISADSSLSDERKKDEIAKIDQGKRLRELGY